MDNQQFCQLLRHLGLSWTGYRKVRKGVKKRIARHMQDLGCRNVSAYLVELDRRNDARLDCERLMTVSISRFFRDRKLWETLQKNILPVLASLSTGGFLIIGSHEKLPFETAELLPFESLSFVFKKIFTC